MQKKFTKIDPYENRKREYDLSKEYCILAGKGLTNSDLFKKITMDQLDLHIFFR